MSNPASSSNTRITRKRKAATVSTRVSKKVRQTSAANSDSDTSLKDFIEDDSEFESGDEEDESTTADSRASSTSGSIHSTDSDEFDDSEEDSDQDDEVFADDFASDEYDEEESVDEEDFEDSDAGSEYQPSEKKSVEDSDLAIEDSTGLTEESVTELEDEQMQDSTHNSSPTPTHPAIDSPTRRSSTSLTTPEASSTLETTIAPKTEDIPSKASPLPSNNPDVITPTSPSTPGVDTSTPALLPSADSANSDDPSNGISIIPDAPLTPADITSTPALSPSADPANPDDPSTDITVIPKAPLTPAIDTSALAQLGEHYAGTTFMPADGNCGYRALATALAEQGVRFNFTNWRGTLLENVRDELAKWLTDNGSHYLHQQFRQHQTAPDETIKEAARRIKGPGHPTETSCWFTAPLDCQIFADRFQCIVLISPMRNSSYLHLYIPTTRGSLTMFPARNITVDQALSDTTLPVVGAAFNLGHADRLDFEDVKDVGFRNLLRDGLTSAGTGENGQSRDAFVRVFEWFK